MDAPPAPRRFAGSHLADFVVEGRTGRRQSQPGYYGCNSAVFDVRPKHGAESMLALKVLYNVEEVQTANVAEHFETDFAFLEDHTRLPTHPGVIQVLTHFIDVASIAALGPSWSVDP
jgi:hypothetical protein